ncbi:MAG: S-layer homology domain-containing protein, partial [Peptococcaceae bacterium]|nr:S-layer homology domain-containing protein [Peptococcaceae bacterium]
FGPNDAITREQLAAILMNYADYKGMDVSARVDLSAYSDADTISSWATDTMEWAVAEGLISGMTADTLEPQGNATRAQVAAIFQRFLEG